MRNNIDRNVKRKNNFRELLKTNNKNVTFPIFSWLEFSLSGLCNRVCVFCPRNNPTDFPNLNNHMPIESYQSVIEDLKKINYRGGIIYSGFSEPILYKYIFDVIKITNKLLPNNRIELVTNGDHLKFEKLKKFFDSGLTQISVSLYDGPHQIEVFKKLQKECNLSDDQFDLRFRWANVESENGLNFGINITNRAGAINMPEINVKKLKTRIKKKCYYPFYQVMIDYDGAVLLCNHDWHKKQILGNINEQSILDIWNNELYKKTRNNLSKAQRVNSPCKECDANGMMMGEEFEDEWKNYYDKN
jgi:radical SAM protein with 4Fe4S-binding SPASM domain